MSLFFPYQYGKDALVPFWRLCNLPLCGSVGAYVTSPRDGHSDCRTALGLANRVVAPVVLRSCCARGKSCRISKSVPLFPLGQHWFQRLPGQLLWEHRGHLIISMICQDALISRKARPRPHPPTPPLPQYVTPDRESSFPGDSRDRIPSHRVANWEDLPLKQGWKIGHLPG